MKTYLKSLFEYSPLVLLCGPFVALCWVLIKIVPDIVIHGLVVGFLVHLVLYLKKRFFAAGGVVPSHTLPKPDRAKRQLTCID